MSFKASLKTFALIALTGSITITGCKKEEGCTDPTATNYNSEARKDDGSCIYPPYAIPTTYNFLNVSYSGQTQRMDMLDSISNYMKQGNSGTVLSAVQMKNMYSNTGSPFGTAALDASGKQLKSKTYSADQTYFDNLFDSLAVVSQSGTNTGSNGTAGVVTSSTDPSKKYLMNANGLEYAQIIKKQLMGAVFYYQGLETYLGNLSVKDNTTVVAGEGTAMEHYTDEAFGYLGVPVNFPANTAGVKYWGEYTDEVNTAIAASAPLMNAFIKLRAAVSNKDYPTRDAQIIIIREQWERVVAASAILELTEAKAGFADDAMRNHLLSEAIGFINALKYNSNKKISQTQIDAALTALGSNLYTISIANIDNAINTINGVYGFDLSKF